MNKFLIRVFIVLSISVFFVSNSNAAWELVNKIDDFTDKKIIYAVYNDKEHRIQISRNGENTWMYITRKGIGTFEPNTNVELRVDKHEVREIPISLYVTMKENGFNSIPRYHWEPKTIGFLLWRGPIKGDCGIMDGLIHGNQLNGRYWIDGLQRDMFSISLSGSKKALTKALGLKKCGK